MTAKYEPGKRWTDEDSGAEYEVVEVEVRYQVRITHTDPDGETETTERVRYPQESLERKVEQDDLTPASKPVDDSDASEGHVCDECGDSFDSAQGLAGHMGKHNGEEN